VKIAIVGYGAEGRAAHVYWTGRGDEIVIHDANADLILPSGIAGVMGDGYLSGLDEYDLIVRSPGVRPDLLPACATITSGTREFFQHCLARIIGVTGTKGKGTTCSLIAAILHEAGRIVHLGGNIGRPALDFLSQVTPNDIVVLELSSFQLADLDRSPDVGVCLMIEPEHLDWHGGMDAYITAKSNIASFQRVGDLLVYHSANQRSGVIATQSAGRRLAYPDEAAAHVDDGIVFFGQTPVVSVSEIGLVGPHNLENVCAALSATWEMISGDAQAAARAIRNFTGLPYRLEKTVEIDGVLYVNDSFSSNPLATMAALRSFDRPLVVILGGFDRGIDLSPLIDAVVAASPRCVVTVGQTGPRIGRLLATCGYSAVIPGGDTMADIVAAARAAAQPGDVVLLSPGCASFDMFKNFQDRGDQFLAAISCR